MPKDIDVQTSVERVDPLVGTIFDKRFRVEERIAAGGFGAIYRATHVKSGHSFALKLLLPSLAKDLGVVARFRREGDTLTALRCPHTITAYELGQATDRTLFITMELLHGESLFERYKANGPFEWKRMARIALQVCESLDEAHALGIVHRDLKPTNIHLETKGDDVDFVKVLDFGIAKILGGSSFDSADLTNAGMMVGTLDYMSPEQMVGGAITGQTDIYTLGIVMYEMISGYTPFPEATTAGQALAAMMKTTPQPLYKRAPVPEELDRIVMRCLEREMHRRYQTVAEVRADLERLLAGVLPDRARAVDTRPVTKHDEEATMMAPVPPALLAESRDPDEEQVTAVARIADLVDRKRGQVIRDAGGNTPTLPTPQESVTAPVPREPVDSATAPLQREPVDSATAPLPRIDLPSLVAAPFSAPPSFPSLRPAPGDVRMPTPPPPGVPLFEMPPEAAPAFDMSRIAARDAIIRRMIWIGVLVLGIVVGFVLATKL